MHNQSYSFLLLYSISTIIFILIISSTSLCDEDELFFNCDALFSCGENFPNITYPFWGGNKSQDCGLPGFQVKCHQDDHHLTIDISHQTFQVLSIDEPNQSLRIARDDLWDDVCPENYQNTSIGPSLFRPGRDVEDITLYYACDDNFPGLPAKSKFLCTANGNTKNGFFADLLAPLVEASIESCETGISVPVLIRELEQFRSNTSVSLQELLNQGFDLEYNIDIIACLACERSSGLCWSGTNSTSPTCLCPDGNHQFICSGDRGVRVFNPFYLPSCSNTC